MAMKGEYKFQWIIIRKWENEQMQNKRKKDGSTSTKKNAIS